MTCSSSKGCSSFFIEEVETLTDERLSNAALASQPYPEVRIPHKQPRRIELPLMNGLRYLSENDLPAWDAMVESSPQGSIFCRSWWLKSVSHESRVLGYFESGRLIAGIPLFHERRMGIKFCCMPKLTQTWGVVMAPLPGKRAAMASRESQILEIFARHLAQQSPFVQAFHPGSQNWLPFYWNGFTQTTHYTYVLDELDSLARVWDGFEQNQRTKIRKAESLGIRVRRSSPEVVFEASMMSFVRQRQRHPIRLPYLCRLVSAARENHAGECFAAVDPEGRVHDAAFFVWDTRRGYFLAGGGDPSLRSSGGGSLLVWRLIQFAASRTAVFDFEGSMIKPIESFFRSFGAKRVPYNRIIKLPGWLRAALCLAGKL
jgi:GNAT acetyltransferase-like protein